MRKVKCYDVCYRLKTSSCFVVTANNKQEAKEKALLELEDMPKDEIIEQFMAALDYEPEFEITSAEYAYTIEEE